MKKSYDSKFKSRVALEALRGGFDRSGNSREVSNSSEFGSAMEKEAAGKCFAFITKTERKAENKPYTEDDLMKKSWCA